MNLFLKDAEKGLVLCKHVPFAKEEDLELLVFENSEVLGDVFPLWRQVRGGAKPGIPDIIGIDREGAVCIVEIKNVPVDEGILPQVLAYAIWAEENPDSIAKMWLEKKDRPEDLSPNFDNYAVRIIVVAPSILPGTVYHMRKVTFPVDLLEVNRYQLDKQMIVAVHKLEAPAPAKNKTTTAAGSYDRAWYEAAAYDAKAIDEYFRAVKDGMEVVKEYGWPIEVKLNKNYASFKVGGSIAFGIDWANSKDHALFFKLAPDVCESLAPKNAGKYRYDAGWKQGSFRLEAGKATIKEFETLMEASVKRLVGDVPG
ncbi:MAG: hypothetical protein M9921_08150 [Fimbriimonadaceae bacterium]|nr:hypothetical protein [Fimbriimonadaceae bacterium]